MDNYFTPVSYKPTLVYAGFWRRHWAVAIDSLILLPLAALMYWLTFMNTSYSWLNSPPSGSLLSIVDTFLQLGVPFLLTVACWVYFRGTPGKLALGLRVVDARTGKGITPGQAVVRYLGYFLSALPLGLGFIWAAWDPKKQTWHDKLAKTAVVFTTDELEGRFERYKTFAL